MFDFRAVLRATARVCIPSASRAAFLGAGCALSLLVACGPPPGAKSEDAKENIRTFKREQNPQRLFDYGRAFAEAGDLTRAEEYFAAAIAAGGDERKIFPRLVRVCVQDGRYQVAVHYAEEHLRQHPADHKSRFLLASLYLGVGNGARARVELEKVLTATPDDAEAHFALAVLMRDTHEDPVGADHHFREYLRLNPGGQHVEEAQSSLLKSVQ